ncbi:uncharacterized protein V3H82_026032 [Fundulus diaphanus]
MALSLAIFFPQTRQWLERTSYGGFVAVTCRRQDGHESSFALEEDDASVSVLFFQSKAVCPALFRSVKNKSFIVNSVVTLTHTAVTFSQLPWPTLSSLPMQLIETYFKKVRSGVVRDTKTVETHLFLYRSGAVIASAHVELSRLHRHYNLPAVSSQEACLIAARDASLLPQAEMGALRAYLGVGQDEQDPPLSRPTPHQLVLVATNLNSLAGSPSGRHPARKRPRETSPEESTDVGAFFQEFPVTLDGQAPTKKQRRDKGFAVDRALYDSWSSYQRNLRRTHLLGK